ncbi:hypothetical protein GT037_002625 [Alternaria burnsii]|uniref:Vegetative incompatibility protein n=1 Tax=Alternaria burnsii TaxID=1187904 RepID=A0A8H7EGB0_9PLEO|nr:uncharacterized protein GT037_002625 [Alternaria burnsii]KAF7678877.1 hypothetical protein GT037_002625 [Alternaria burnsii]
MRLLHITDDGKLKFTKDIILKDEVPPYAILSHTWGDQEVVFNDMKSLDDLNDVDAKKKDGWKKIDFCAQQAKRDGLKYFWIDTCCIDKANHTELSEAINSMFRWYQKAERCYAFLSDIQGKSSEGECRSSSRWKAAFRASRWFSRGWTLQELLAPRSVEFFSRDEAWLGDKESLKQTIHEITKIPIDALTGSDLSKFDIDERFSWAQSRQTTREEDGAYCLLGIFGCHLPLIYGEGKEKALERLRKEMPEASERLSKIRCWLSAPDPSTNYHKAQKQRQADTGLWLLNSAQFENWKTAAASRLWLHGIPGCGKTILSSTIIEHMLLHCENDIQKVTVYFYFDFNDSQKQNPEPMLRSLLRQLLQCLAVTHKDVDALFLSCKNGEKQPSLHELLDVMPKVMRQFTHVYIVLDALDECTQRSELMSMLESVIGWKLDMVHLLLTSRKERDIEMSLEGHIEEDNVVSLQRDIVNEDISRYVRNRLHEDKALAKWNKDADIRQEIETALMSRAGGMFRWAACQLDMLAKSRNLAALRKSLASLPQTLDQTYDRILTAIREEDRVYAIRILQWLTFSERPLTIEEVAEVAAIDIQGEPVFDRDEVLIDPLEALDICSSLITVTGSAEKRKNEDGRLADSRILSLAHYSVQEYLVSDRIKQGPAKQYHMQEVESHEAILKGCIGYLNQFQGPITDAQFDISALAMYSAEFWISHFEKAGGETENVCRIALSIFSMDSPAYQSWLRLWDPEQAEMGDDPLILNRGLDDMATPLYHAARLGLGKITKLLLDQGADVNAQGGEFGNALMAASNGGHTAVAELLINAGANVNSIQGFWGSPLCLAAGSGSEAMVKLLIDAGADINAPMPKSCAWGNALQAALEWEKEAMVKLLLEEGADCGLDEYLRGPIHYALISDMRTPSLISILQQHGASIDAIDIENMTPLHYCARNGDQKAAEKLLDAGVPIDIGVRRKSWPRDGDTSSPIDQVDTVYPIPESIAVGLAPLHFAALTGNLTMTKFFLDHGADPNALSEYGETPLHLNQRLTLYGTRYKDSWTRRDYRLESRSRSRYRYEMDPNFSSIASTRERILDALLDHPNISTATQDYQGENLLHCIKYGKPESVTLVQKLLSRGADPSCVNSSQKSPLRLASEAGDTASVVALLSTGTKAVWTEECLLHALDHATRNGDHEAIVAILELKEARALKLVATKNEHGQNLLHRLFCARYIRIDTVQWLLDEGADSSELDDFGLSPLARLIQNYTWQSNIEEICRLLLKITGNESFVDCYGRNLGHLCAATPNFETYMLKAFNDHGVDLARRDCGGGTVLHSAAMSGFLTAGSLEYLVNSIGIQANEEDAHGRTALQYAIEEAWKERGSDTMNPERWKRTRNILAKHHATVSKEEIGLPPGWLRAQDFDFSI